MLVCSNAERAQFHRALAAQQEEELAALLHAPLAAPAPQHSAGAALADALRAFQRTHGALLGSGPFLRGWRAWLEAQLAQPSPLVWKLRVEALTLAGGPAWTRDAVALLRGHTQRRTELELPDWCASL